MPLEEETINSAFAFEYSLAVPRRDAGLVDLPESEWVQEAEVSIAPSQKEQRDLHHHQRMLLGAGGEERKEGKIRPKSREIPTHTASQGITFYLQKVTCVNGKVNCNGTSLFLG